MAGRGFAVDGSRFTVSGRTFPEIGVSEGFHALSHHGDNPEKMAQLAKVNAHHVSMLAYFADRLQSTAVALSDRSLASMSPT